MTQPVLQVSNLRFHYPQSSAELRLDSFILNLGERVFVEAPSGAGKTTLLSLIAGVLQPVSGFIELLGQPFSSLPETKRDYLRGCHIGYIFQQFNLLPELTARENLLLLEVISPDRFRGMSASQRQQQWSQLASALGIGTFLDRPANRLSMGQAQRVAVMRALLGRPALILADEPTSALDADNRDSFLILLEQLCSSQGTALVFVSHDAQLKNRFERQIKLSPMTDTNE